MAKKVADVEIIVTDTEVEALILGEQPDQRAPAALQRQPAR
ncbi:MAG: hypothetical protein U5R48_12290 [Gammaproteobacteria bacterium]|nr:hypothetical protein [Gammaproteobacteria bacterium]